MTAEDSFWENALWAQLLWIRGVGIVLSIAYWAMVSLWNPKLYYLPFV